MHTFVVSLIQNRGVNVKYSDEPMIRPKIGDISFIKNNITDYASNIIYATERIEKNGYVSPEHMNLNLMLRENAFKINTTLENIFELFSVDANIINEPPKYFDAVKYVENICKQYSNMCTYKNEIAIEFVREAREKFVTIEIKPFERIILNILSNACKFRRENSRNKVQVTVISKPPESFVIKIKDHGIGIPRENKDKVFEMYKYLPAYTCVGLHDFTGPGLGLAICRKAARDLGGDVKYTSQVGRGTEFVITLPNNSKATGFAMREAPPESFYDIPHIIIQKYLY